MQLHEEKIENIFQRDRQNAGRKGELVELTGGGGVVIRSSQLSDHPIIHPGYGPKQDTWEPTLCVGL